MRVRADEVLCSRHYKFGANCGLVTELISGTKLREFLRWEHKNNLKKAAVAEAREDGVDGREEGVDNKTKVKALWRTRHEMWNIA